MRYESSSDNGGVEELHGELVWGELRAGKDKEQGNLGGLFLPVGGTIGHIWGAAGVAGSLKSETAVGRNPVFLSKTSQEVGNIYWELEDAPQRTCGCQGPTYHPPGRH